DADSQGRLPRSLLLGSVRHGRQILAGVYGQCIFFDGNHALFRAGRDFMHLTSELALDLLDGRSEASQNAILNAHIEECEDCRRRFEKWSKVRFLLKRAHLVKPPADLRAKAERIFEPEPPERKTIRQILAEIIFDSPTQTLAMGA